MIKKEEEIKNMKKAILKLAELIDYLEDIGDKSSPAFKTREQLIKEILHGQR